MMEEIKPIPKHLRLTPAVDRALFENSNRDNQLRLIYETMCAEALCKWTTREDDINMLMGMYLDNPFELWIKYASDIHRHEGDNQYGLRRTKQLSQELDESAKKTITWINGLHERKWFESDKHQLSNNGLSCN